MTRNLKALGLSLMAVIAIGALAAQGASAVVDHQFHSDGEKVNVTGQNLTTHEFVVGSAGTVKCNTATTEGTNTYTLISAGTYEADQLTVSTHYNDCTFGGSPATVNTEHCAFVFDSDTTLGNPTVPSKEHANVDIECSGGSSIKIATSVCTLTIGPQTIKHAVTYESDPDNTNAIIIKWTAHSIVTGNLNDKPGCALVPKGAVGKHTGNTTLTCYADTGSVLSGTDKTTPTEKLVHGPETLCEIAS